jgi:hypothetical protein
VIEALDLAVLDRDDLDLGAGVLERIPRLLEFDPLEHVGGQDRDLLPLHRVCHARPLLRIRVPSTPTRRGESYASR